MKTPESQWRRIVWATIATAVVCGGIFVALMDPYQEVFRYDRVVMGLVLGTLFGHASLAAVFTALGPAPLVHRLPIFAAWLTFLGLAQVVNAWRYPQPGPAVTLIATFGQWLLIQVPLWAIVWRRRLQIRPDGDRTGRTQVKLQFGIRQLIILTAIVAALLGAGRALIPTIQSVLEEGAWVGQGPAFAFVVATNVVLTLPLAMGILLPRGAMLACGLGLAFIALATWCEISGLWVFVGRVDVAIQFWVMNYCQAAWVLGPLAILRLGGYRLTSTNPTSHTTPVAS